MEEIKTEVIEQPKVKPVIDRREYSKKYYHDHRDNWFIKHKCEICSGSYITANKSRHEKCAKHKRASGRTINKIDKRDENMALLRDVIHNKIQNLDLIGNLVNEIWPKEKESDLNTN